MEEDHIKQSPPSSIMKTPNPEATFLGIPQELRSNIYEYILPNQKSLYKLPFEDEYTTNYVQTVTKISSRLHKIDIPLLTVNKQVYFESLPVLQKFNNFHIHRFEQLRSAVFGSPSGLSDQFRHITLHGDIRLNGRGTYELEHHLFINISDWTNLRYLCLASSDFHNMFSESAMMNTVHARKPPASLEIKEIHRLGTQIRDGLQKMGQLFAQLLSFNDGCLRIQGHVFYDTFQVYGRKGKITAETVHEFITKLQLECTAAAKSGKCFHAPLEVVVAGVKVSIGYTMTGITTARIL